MYVGISEYNVMLSIIISEKSIFIIPTACSPEYHCELSAVLSMLLIAKS